MGSNSTFTFGSDSTFLFQFPDNHFNINVGAYVIRKLKIGAHLGRTNCITDCASGESFSCSEVIAYAHRVKSFLIRNGFKRGDTLVYSSHHPSRLHIFLLGVWLANGVVRSSYPEDVVDELLNRLLESQSRWVLCDTEFASENLSLASQAPWKVNVIVPEKAEGCISFEDVFREISNGNYNSDFSLETSSDDTVSTDIALILPTSGTTGRSKGAVITHQQLLRKIIMLEQMPLVSQIDEPFLLGSKLTHKTGCTFPLGVICAGRRVIINSKPTVENLVEAINKFKVYGILVFPKLALELADYVGTESNSNSSTVSKLSSLKRVATAGQSMKDVSFVMKRLKLESFIKIYGMTELGRIATNVSWRNSGNHEVITDTPDASCGKLVPGVQLVIRDIETGAPLGPNSVGELYVLSPFAFKAYLNNPQAQEEINSNGWFRTGDLGYIDKKGFVFVTGRTKEIFKYYNNHINPTDLEEVLLQHPLVKEAAVVGVPDPNGGDSIPRAFVVLKQNSEPLLQGDIASDICVFFDGQVASYKKLRGGLVILSKMPYGKTGKLLKTALLNCVEPMCTLTCT